MGTPSLKRLEAAFPTKGKELRELLTGVRKTHTYSSVIKWEIRCANPLGYNERLMCALDEILEGYGVEPIWSEDDELIPTAEYVNMGDTYVTTLLLNRVTGSIQITSWGDWVEKNKRRYKLW